MQLLIDIGNQNVKWQFDDQCGSFTSRSSTMVENCETHFAQLPAVDGVVFVNVAELRLTDQLREFAQKRWAIEAHEVSAAEEQCGVLNGYQNVEELGADRWVALIGAWSIDATAAIIVDCGTAITVDALTTQGEFIGGSILPGFDLARDALWQRTTGIDEFTEFVPEIPSRSTIEAVSSGVIYATVGGVDHLVHQYRTRVGKHSKLILTGGASQIIAHRSAYQFILVPNLTLIGLAVIAKTLSTL